MLLWSAMTRMLPLLLVATTLLPGCFTIGGAVIGGQADARAERARTARLQRGEPVGAEDRDAMVTGVVLGLALDALATYALISAVDLSGPNYWYGSPDQTRGY